MNRIIVVFLCFFVLFGVVDILKCNAGDDSCCGYESPNNPFPCGTHEELGHIGDIGNCTWWCYYCAPNISPSSGNAEDWLSNTQAPVGNSPMPGSIAVFENENFEPLGHVAYVESVNSDGSFNVTEMGYDWFNCMRPNTYDAGSATGFILPNPQDHSLVRIEGTNPVYWLQNGKAYHVLSFDIIDAMAELPGWSGDKIYVYPEDSLEIISPGNQGEDTFEQGPDFISTNSESNGLLIQLPDDPKVYLIEEGVRRWITTENLFVNLGYNWNDVIVVTQAILNLIPEIEDFENYPIIGRSVYRDTFS